MKFKFLISLAMAGASLGAFAQTHLDGIDYYKAGQLSNAKELLERNMNASGTDKALSYYYIGRVNQDWGNLAEAKQAYNAGIAANAECPYNYVGLASLDLKSGDVKGAEANIKMAEKFAKKDAELQIEIARAYYDANPVTYEKKIDKAMEKARKFNMADPAIYLFEGDRLRDQGGDNETIGKAANMYEMAASYDKQAAAAYVKYANLFKKIRPEFGIRMLEELLANNPNSALGQRELALAYYNMDNYKAAADQYGKYVKNPNHFKADENEYAFLLFYNGEYKKGYDYATQLLAKNPDDFTAQRFQFMNAAQDTDMPSEQLLALADALYNKHVSNPTKNKMAQIDFNLIIDEYRSNKMYDKAEQAANEALKEFPDALKYNYDLARIYNSQRRYSEAADAMNRYMAKNAEPKYSELYYSAIFNKNAGVTSSDDAAKQKNYYNHMKNYAAEAAKDYKTVGAYALLGDAYSLLGDTPQAMATYEEGVALYEANPKADDTEDAAVMYGYLANFYKTSDAAKASSCAERQKALTK